MVIQQRHRDTRPAGATATGTIVIIIVAALVLIVVGYGVGRAARKPPVPDPAAAAVPADPSAPAAASQTQDPAPRGAFAPSEGPPRAAPPTRQPAPARPYRIVPTQLSFGHVAPGQVMDAEFWIHNVSDGPVIVASIEGDPEVSLRESLDGSVIPPREKLTVPLDVSFRTSTTGPRRATVTIAIAGYEPPATLLITGEVTRAVKATPAYLHAARADRGEITIESIDGRAFTVLAVNGTAADFVGYDPARDPARARYVLRWDLAGYDDRCRDAEGRIMPTWWIIETDHPGAPIVDLLVRHTCAAPEPPPATWRLGERRVVLGAIRAGEPVELSIPIVPMRGARPGDDPIVAVTSDDEGVLKATLIGVSEGRDQATCRVEVIPDPGHRGLITTTIQFRTATERTSLTVIATVR